MILNIETTTQVGSVSLAVEGNSWIVMEELETGDHAKNITLFIEEVLKIADINRWDIKSIAVSSGPGSYTGLRIGLSVAKGLCFALDVPLLGVPTLKALSYGVIKNYKLNENDRIIALMDARRMDAYAAVYDYKLNEVKAPFFLTLESDSFDVFIENEAKLYFCGNAAEKFNSLTSKSAFIFTSVKNPCSLFMEKLSFDLYQKGEFEDLAYFEPFYLKPPNITKPKSIL
jgi:tRNA threonylcarbamoyladenosine biosynthesis protein TsaB